MEKKKIKKRPVNEKKMEMIETHCSDETAWGPKNDGVHISVRSDGSHESYWLVKYVVAGKELNFLSIGLNRRTVLVAIAAFTGNNLHREPVAVKCSV